MLDTYRMLLGAAKHLPIVEGEPYALTHAALALSAGRHSRRLPSN